MAKRSDTKSREGGTRHKRPASGATGKSPDMQRSTSASSFGTQLAEPAIGSSSGSQPESKRQTPREAVQSARAAIHRALSVVGVFSLAINALLLSIPLYLFQVSDRVLLSGSLDTLVMLTVITVGALMLLAGLDFLRRFVLTRAALRLETTLGGHVFTASLLSAASAPAHDVQGLRDISQLRAFLSGPVVPLMFDAPVAPFYILVVYLIHPQLGLIAAVGAILLFGIALSNQMLTSHPLAQMGGHSMAAFAKAQSHVRNSEVINAMGMHDDCLQLWGRDNAQALRSQSIANDRNACLTAVSKLLRLGLQVAILGWGTFLALNAELTGGMMIAASIIAGRALAPVEGSIEGWRSVIGAKMAYQRIKLLLAQAGWSENRTTLPAPDGRLAVEKLTFLPAGRREPILSDINFELAAGESLAIIGPTGAGKSTLARLMVGGLSPVLGCVRLDGTDVRNWDRLQLGGHVGYLPQDVELFPGTIAANIARMKMDADPEEIVAAAKLACVHDLITRLPNGYDTEIAVDGSPLSGGQRQRVALARAFFEKPCFIVLDEPNANLDGPGEEALLHALANARGAGLTVVTITQRSAVLRCVDRILLLQDGRIETLGPRDEVLARLIRGRQASDQMSDSAVQQQAMADSAGAQ